MSTRTAIVALAQTLCYQLGDTTEMTRIFDEIMVELGQDDRAWLSQIAVFNGGTIVDPTDRAYLEFPLSLNLVKCLALFFDGRQLSRETVQNLDAITPEWRSRVDDPLAYVVEGENDRQMRLYPQASVQKSGDTISSVEGGPAAIYTETRTTAIPDYLEMPLAWLVLSREFERESPHRDQAFATAAKGLGLRYLEYCA